MKILSLNLLFVLLFFSCIPSFSQSYEEIKKKKYPPLYSTEVVNLAFTSSTLPIVVINTNGQTIIDDPKIIAHMGIIDNGVGVVNNLTDPFNGYNNNIGIEIRGNGSQAYPKKSYGFETLNAANEETNYPILGMPTNSDWTLIATVFDKTLMRNSLMYKLWERMGYYSVRTRYCEVVLNGTYVGVYTLTERIKRGTNRVNIKKLEATDDVSKISGGYMVKTDFLDPPDVNYWVSALSNANSGKNYIVFQPKPVDLNTDQFNYIRQYFTDFETVLASNTFSDPTNGYRKYIDENTFMDFFLVQELSKNIDGYIASIYFHKDRNGKLKMGPVWDFDWSINYEGNPVECTESNLTSGWMFRGNNCLAGLSHFWWERFLQDCFYTAKLRNRFQQLRQTSFSNENINTLIDSLANHLNVPMTREYAKWGLTIHATNNIDHQTEVNKMKNWLFSRLAWMDSHVQDLDTFTPTITSSIGSPIFGSNVTLTSTAPISNSQIEWKWEYADGTGSHNSGTATQLNVVPRDIITYKARFVKNDGSCNTYYSNNITLNVASLCNSQINMTETISSPTTPSAFYKSSNFIQASGKVENNTKVKFQSEKSVLFLPGFSSDSGGIMTAEIKNCN